jgi:hypothetical protein
MFGYTALGRRHGATGTADHRGEVELESVAWFKALPRARTCSPGSSLASSRFIHRWKYSVCIAPQMLL